MNLHAARNAILVGLVGVLPATAFAHTDVFKKGIEARNRNDWPEVVADMRRAIEADDRESNQGIRVGGRLGLGGVEYPYLPYFFLGEALLAQDDCAGAIDAWSRSEQQAVVTGERLAAIHRGYLTCESKGFLVPAAHDPLVEKTSQTIADAEALFLRVAELASSNRWLLREPVDTQLERARKDLDAARTRLQAGMRSRRAADVRESATLADRGAEQLRVTESALHATIEAATRVQQLFTQVAAQMAAAAAADRDVERSGVALTAPMVAQRRAGNEKLARARELRDSGQQTQNAARIADALALARSALGMLAEVRRQAETLARQSPERPSLEERGVSLPLQDGAGLFLRGEYRHALAVLDAAAGWPATPELQLHVHLFRAAAHLALYQRSGEVDPANLEHARAAIDRCKRIDPQFRPDPGVFTPRFIELYRSDRVAAPSSRR